MKRIFIFSVLMIAFVMNAVAWEPVIKETHWFGMHEFYDSPIPPAPIDFYLSDADFSKTNNWTEVNNGGTITIGNGRIGLEQEEVNGQMLDTRYSITVGNNNQTRTLYPTREGYSHTKDTWCFGFNSRWQNNYCSYQQITTKKLVAGTYRFTFDVENANSAYTHTPNNHNKRYENLFYVKVGNNNPIYDTRIDWMDNGNGGWRGHSIEFTVDGTQDVTISLGYGTGNNNLSALETPVLFVCNLYLETVSAERDPRITWSDDYIESISVVKDWTGKRPSQQPQTLYYSWLDHTLRFSVEDKNVWWLNKDDADHYGYDGLGLCNTSSVSKKFYIHNLKAGDEINIEYYKYDGRDPSPTLESGSFTNLNVGEKLYGRNGELVYYKLQSDGDVCINIPSKTLIRAIRIIHNQDNYKKATYAITQVTDDDNNIGYKYTLTGAGVLEDKRGAVPYITMRFGADNDMTFVKKLDDGDNSEYAAFSIVDETNDFNPSSARLQSIFQNLTESQVKDRLAGKEWTVFSTDLEANGSDKFSTILPQYGTYYYFFPEVNGKLSLRFYCEGSYEHMPFWFKSKNGVVVDNLTRSQDTDGSYYYEYNDINVEKGGVYYLCSNPTIVHHERPIVRLISYEFIPTFRVDPLYNVVENGTTACTTNWNREDLATVFGGEFNDLLGDVPQDEEHYIVINGERQSRVKCVGNVESATPYFYKDGQDHLKLGFKDITYKYKPGDDTTKEINKGGAIIVHIDCAAGKASFVLTIAYKAEGAEWAKDVNGKKIERKATSNATSFVKRWDFFSGAGDGADGGWDLGKYYNNFNTSSQSENTSSKLYKEVNKADGLTADWSETYVNLKDKEEPIFKSVYDMEGDNADMIHETAGLLFHTESNLMGVFNENAASTSSFADRYIGLMGPSSLPLKDETTGEAHPRALIIPRLTAGDRIVIKMGCYGNVPDDEIVTQTAKLKITGAKDPTGKAINATNGDYIIGGSGVEAGNDTNEGSDINDKSQPWGEYHFISTGGDFTLEVEEGELVKLYSIVIYRSDDILTENEILGDEDKLQILNTQDFSTAADAVELHMHYRGLNEATNYALTEAKTGNLQDNDIVLGSPTAGTLWYPCMVNLGQRPFTPDKAKFGVFKATLGVQTKGEKYVTDYAYCMIPVGYRETKTYPYTWDLTDLKKYVSASINANGTEKEVADADADLRIWDGWNLRVKPDEWDGNIFVSGGQLYGGKTMIDETRGLGITHDNNNVASITGTTTDETGSLSVGSGEYGFIIPQVDKNQAIYVRAHKVGNTQKSSYEESDGTSTYIFGKEGATVNEIPYHETIDDDTKDEVFALVMPSNLSEKHDVRLNFQGYEVKKIAVSDAPKTLSAKGWTSESRDYVIDPSLTAYMTGKNFRTFIVSGVDYSTKTVTLTRIDNNYLMTKVAEEGDNNACVILNGTSDSGIEGSSEGVFDSQFHLFVPDMHESKSLWSGDNDLESKLKAQLNKGTVNAVDGDYTNFAFTCMYYDIDPKTGIIQSEKKVGPQAFYRIAGGKTGTASSKGNQGYLPIKTSEVGYPVEDNNGAGARFTLVIIDDNEATGIATVERIVQDGRFYNLNGQQLDGTPNRSGLYIVNGKKVYIKNK